FKKRGVQGLDRWALSRSRHEPSGSQTMIRALIAGRCRVHLEALAAAVSHSRAVEVLGTASHRLDILARARDDSPDIVLIDATMTDAANIVRDVRQHAQGVKVVVITMGETEAEITQLAEAGVAG